MVFGAGPFGGMPFGGAPDDIHAVFDLERQIGGEAIITVASFVDQALLKHWHENPQDLRVIDRRKFEELVAELFSGFGYEVELTKRTRDGGKDIVAIKRSAESDVKYLIECKRPNPGKPVGVSTVRELHSVKMTEKATKAILATTTYFTHDARQLFEQHRWELELKDFESIQHWIAEYLQIQGHRGTSRFSINGAASNPGPAADS